MSSDFLTKDVVYVSSANRLNGNSSSFLFDFTTQIKTPNNYNRVSLLNFSCPKGYYLITSVNNTFTITEGLTTYTITIPAGNYSFYGSLNKLSTVLLDLIHAVCSFTYVITPNTSTGKYTFSVSGNAGVQPIFIFNNSLSKILGFEQATYQFTAGSLSSVSVVNFQKATTIKLCSDLVKKSVLSIIIPNVNDFSDIGYTEFNPNYTSHELIKPGTTSARFFLIDGETDTLIDLNGLDYNFTFVLFRTNDYFQHMLEDTKKQATISALEAELKAVDKKLSELK